MSLAAAGVVRVAVRSPTALPTGPIVEITAPPDGFKLRQGRRASVRLHVTGGAGHLRDWRVQLIAPDGSAEDLASGSQPVVDRAVAQLSADTLEAGARYTLEVRAHDTAGAEASARATFLIPDPQYTLIPLEPGNFSRGVSAALSVDGSGDIIAFGGASGELAQVFILNARTGILTEAQIIASSEGQKLSANGKRFFFKGGVPPRLIRDGIGFLDIDTGRFTLVAPDADVFFTVDAGGRRIAYQYVDTSSGTEQYYLYDQETQAVRRLTDDSQAIDHNGLCPRELGTTPIISGVGDTVALITRATLGLVPADPSGCHIFAYDVPTATLRHVRTLSPSTSIDLPAISDDGRWLTFIVLHQSPPLPLRDYPALLDLKTGELIDPLGGITDSTSFDAVISGDASVIVISSEADLDARVGNADQNLELFMYNRVTREFTQISETTGGIGRFPGGCPAYRPAVSSDARVVAFWFLSGISGEGCVQDGPQRNELDGLDLGRVRAVRKRPANGPPIFVPPRTARVEAGKTLSVDLRATDPDGDAIAFFAQEIDHLDVPMGAAVEDRHDGTATFTWKTRPEDTGVRHVRVAAFDEGGGEVFHDVTVAVCSRIANDGSLSETLRALFDSDPPAECRDADLNHDGALTAADMVGALIRGE